MDLPNINQHREEGKRLAEIVRILGRYGLANWFGKIPIQSVRDLLASKETQASKDFEKANSTLSTTENAGLHLYTELAA